MTRRKRISNRVRNEWSNSSSNVIWTWSPLRYSEVYYTIDNKYYHNCCKYSERLSLFFIIPFFCSNEPYSHKYKYTPYDYDFSEKLYQKSIFCTHKRSCVYEKLGIKVEKVLHHGFDCIELLRKSMQK